MELTQPSRCAVAISFPIAPSFACSSSAGACVAAQAVLCSFTMETTFEWNGFALNTPITHSLSLSSSVTSRWNAA